MYAVVGPFFFTIKLFVPEPNPINNLMITLSSKLGQLLKGVVRDVYWHIGLVVLELPWSEVIGIARSCLIKVVRSCE